MKNEWYKKEGDMVWYTMYAWCIRIVRIYAQVNDDGYLAWPLPTESRTL